MDRRARNGEYLHRRAFGHWESQSCHADKSATVGRFARCSRTSWLAFFCHPARSGFVRYAAADEVTDVLKAPFTVHTAFSDALGDGKYKRIYAFITTSTGEDLAERLVRKGLARAFGVSRETPAGKSTKDYREFRQDEELQAAKRGAGAWARTNWEKLAAERQAERPETEELGLATPASILRPGQKINTDAAARDQIMLLIVQPLPLPA